MFVYEMCNINNFVFTLINLGIKSTIEFMIFIADFLLLNIWLSMVNIFNI